MGTARPLRDFGALRRALEEGSGEPLVCDEGMWSLCNDRSLTLMDGSNFLELRELYLHMAEYLQREGRDPACVLEEAGRAQLLHLRLHQGVRRVTIHCRDDACPPCREAAGRNLSLDEALETSPLPHRECRRHPGGSAGCRCAWLAAGG